MPLKKALEIIYIEITVSVEKGANYAMKEEITEAMAIIGQNLELLMKYKKQYGEKI